MADCGNKELIRAAGGQTYDRVCKGVFGVTLYCNKGDYDDWRTRLDELAAQLLVTWNRLMTIEQGQPEQTYPKTRAVREWYDRILARLAELPEGSVWGPAAEVNPFAGDSPAKVIPKMVGIATDMVCLLQTMQEAIASYGEKAPPVPHVTPEKGPQIDIGGAVETTTKAAQKVVETLAWPAALVGVALLLGPIVVQRIAKGATSK